MPTIKYQKLVPFQVDSSAEVMYDEDRPTLPLGPMLKGSASIIDTVYNPEVKGNCEHPVLERLGKVLYVTSGTSGIFKSADRGIVEYDLLTDVFQDVDKDDPRIAHTGLNPTPKIRVDLGDAFLLLQSMADTGMLGVLQKAFPDSKQYQRVIAHLFHTVLKNSAHKACDEYISTSVLSYLLDDISIGSLKCDSAYFAMMGDVEVKASFFRAYIAYKRKTNPEFGRGCYVDSTPLPGDAKDNPFNAMCSHGTGGPTSQTRLALVLDEATSDIIWYTVVCGNVLDHTTFLKVQEEVELYLGLEINCFVLDAGYAYDSAIYRRFNTTNLMREDMDGVVRPHMLIVRMPSREDFPHAELYHKYKSQLFDVLNDFNRGGHTYFGVRDDTFDVKGNPEHCYVYLDKEKALSTNRHYMVSNPDEWESLSPEEKRWAAVKDGFFILVSNQKMEPCEMLDEYTGRAHIETIFKSGKEYLDILPLAKWTKERILGKILNDVIAMVLYGDLLQQSGKLGVALTRMINTLTVVECDRREDGGLNVSCVNKQCREWLEALGYVLPAHILIQDLKDLLFKGIRLPGAQMRKKRGKKASTARKKVSAKLAVPKTKEQRQAEKEAKAAAKRAEKEAAKAAAGDMATN